MCDTESAQLAVSLQAAPQHCAFAPQAFPHAPQFIESVWRSTQASPHWLLLQLPVPVEPELFDEVEDEPPVPSDVVEEHPRDVMREPASKAQLRRDRFIL